MLWGHLCWHIVHWHGEERLQQFFAAYRDGEPPVLLSDGFPGDLLPRPLLPPGFGSAARPPHKKDRLEAAKNVKALAKANWLTRGEFEEVRRGHSIAPQTTSEQLKKMTFARSVTKNWILRDSDTSGDPFDVEEIYQRQVTVLWRVRDESHADLVQDFLTALAHEGYGKRKSVGYGALKSCTLEECADFEAIEGANAVVSLSRFVPAPSDPVQGFWNVAVKYPKLGEEGATSGDPFKQPLLQIESGSLLRLPEGKAPRPYYGQLVEGIHAKRPEIMHYGYAFAVGMKIAPTS